ncbi:unnamed protein product [Rotaria sordida]|uniref:Uncharacterized protein n=1 Tax=Rotaria sordida TaxID=392033 RepID=A0A818PGE7_9BILA|nr:unnamed protein product [Rotaria sordida]CAF3620960.1 unnamed protein product [Rotaria sordida]
MPNVNEELDFIYEIRVQFDSQKMLLHKEGGKYEEQQWNLSIDTLRNKILSFDEENPNKKILLEQLNQTIHQLTLQFLLPSEQTIYIVW